MSSPSDAEQIAAAALDILRRAKQSGHLDGILAQLMEPTHEESGFQVVEGGSSMTDASKRRMVFDPAPPRGDRAGESDGQLPVTTAVSKAKGDPEVSLPPGIASQREWGQTVLQVGKFAKSGLSYTEMLQSDDVDRKEYVKWAYTQISRTDLTPAMIDFVRFVRFSHYQEQGHHLCFEGSMIPRKFKK